jgi:GNAT superfamily N-acetyltransferase
VEIVPAAPSDADAISALILGLSDPFFLEPSRVGAEPFLASVSPEGQRRYLQAGNYSYHVAKSQGQLVGLVALRDNAHLFHLFVAQPFQGQGLARRLWHVVQDEALRAGNPGSFTVNASLNAVPVYEKFGFVRQGDVRRMNGVAFQPMCRGQVPSR